MVKRVYRQDYDETYSRATVTLEVKRHTQFHIWQMIVPLGIVLGVALLASWLPARRAAKVDPVVALRSE